MSVSDFFLNQGFGVIFWIFLNQDFGVSFWLFFIKGLVSVSNFLFLSKVWYPFLALLSRVRRGSTHLVTSQIVVLISRCDFIIELLQRTWWIYHLVQWLSLVSRSSQFFNLIYTVNFCDAIMQFSSLLLFLS